MQFAEYDLLRTHTVYNEVLTGMFFHIKAEIILKFSVLCNKIVIMKNCCMPL